MVLSFEKALLTVKEKLSGWIKPQIESVALECAWRRVLAEDVTADRDYPPFNRSTRDGYAVQAGDTQSATARLTLKGEVPAGYSFHGKVSRGECVQVMTGAPVPEGADAVVMLEHTKALGTEIEILRSVVVQENIVQQGSEAARGTEVLRRGTRLGAGDLALLASVGKDPVAVFCQPMVAVLATGDEIISVDGRPDWFQVRDSNSKMLAAGIQAAGGVPRLMGIAPDKKGNLRRKLQECFEADLVLIAGGVSAGKYDYVESVLGELGAEFFFDGVMIRPGKPVVFGGANGKLFFGLPGNPVSAFVTFCIFALPAIRWAGGESFDFPVPLKARLEGPIRNRGGMTRFIPSRICEKGGEAIVHPVDWQGSGDLAGLARADSFVVVHPDGPEVIPAGEWVDVFPKPV